MNGIHFVKDMIHVPVWGGWVCDVSSLCSKQGENLKLMTFIYRIFHLIFWIFWTKWNLGKWTCREERTTRHLDFLTYYMFFFNSFSMTFIFFRNVYISFKILISFSNIWEFKPNNLRSLCWTILETDLFPYSVLNKFRMNHNILFLFKV